MLQILIDIGTIILECHLNRMPLLSANRRIVRDLVFKNFEGQLLNNFIQIYQVFLRLNGLRDGRVDGIRYRIPPLLKTQRAQLRHYASDLKFPMGLTGSVMPRGQEIKKQINRLSYLIYFNTIMILKQY